MTQDRFEELLGLLLDDEVSRGEIDELIKSIAADPLRLQRLREHLTFSDHLSQYEDELRDERQFLSALQIRMHAADDTEDFVSQVVASVQDEETVRHSEDPSNQSQRGNQGGRRFPLWAIWVTVAVVPLLVAGTLLYWAIDGGRQADTSPPKTIGEGLAGAEAGNDNGVAVLTQVAGLQGAALRDWRVGETIAPGSMTWDAGLVQLEFYCGATVVAEGPAEIEIIDESRVVCRLGRLRAHVPEQARGFAVLAPSFELVDLGTEFGVNVSNDGAAEVHVFDGKVELYDVESNRNLESRRELNAGEALTVDRDGTSKPMTARDADFVTSVRLGELADAQQQVQLRDWRSFRDSLKNDPRVVAYFPFDKSDTADRLLTGHDANGEPVRGAIVGCEWAEGRWSGKTSLQFKRPGDRVRITLPGEYKSFTYSTWVRVDGLDRTQHSLLMTDGFGKNGIHWQIRQDGDLVLGIRYSSKHAHSYQSDSIFNPFRLGQWVHLVTVYDTSRARVTHYVNGNAVKHVRLKRYASGMRTIGNATIGNWSAPTSRHGGSSVRNFNGRIDELIVFSDALDDQEVRQIYKAGRP